MGAPHHPVLWALHVGGNVELYDMHPFELDAERLADFRATDFARLTGLEIPADHVPVLIRLRADIARNR